MRNGERALIGVSLTLGVFSLAAAGALWITRTHHAPPNVIVQAPPPQPAPNVIVQAPAPTFPAPIGATPSVPRDLLTTDDGRKVKDVHVDMKKHTDTSIGPRKKTKKKAKGSIVKKVQSRWSAPEEPAFDLGSIFNGKR